VALSSLLPYTGGAEKSTCAVRVTEVLLGPPIGFVAAGPTKALPRPAPLLFGHLLCRLA
ncbi:Hypothetical predicted protein, partial [Marmota monax]